jgi:hypothetical protein
LLFYKATLKNGVFYKKKADTEGQSQPENQISSKPQQKIDEMFNIQNILNEKNN